MYYSQLFSKTRKDAPKDEESKNAKLLIRGGFIHKEMSGVYDLLPLGLRVIKKIEQIIREEMNVIGGQEMELTTLQDPELWKKTDRWEENEDSVWFKTNLNNNTQIGLGFTHEEPLTRLMTDHIHSYRDLPQYIYQFQTKFRNELRAKSGILRGREFLMKDLYSFSRTQEEHDDFYERARQAYFNIFERVGLGDKTYLTFASGGSFSKFSHEFQTVTEAGEDIIYIPKDEYGKGIKMEKGRAAINKEIYTDDVKKDIGVEGDFEKVKSVEVGNIFTLGTRFSDALELKFEDEKGNKHSVFMGSYGIGLGRLMGTVVEILSDENGIVWPEEIAPFKVHLISLGSEDAKQEADKLYKELEDKKIEVFFDDREEVSAGTKFADADLLGMPYRIVISDKTLKKNSVEIKHRTGKEEIVAIKDVYDRVK